MNIHRRQSKSRWRPRSGAAFLLLVMMLLLVVVGGIGHLVRSETMSRQGEVQRWRTKTMIAAIESAQSTSETIQKPIRLPVDPSQWIEVELDSTQSRVIATWYREDRIVDTMSRPIDTKTESQP